MASLYNYYIKEESRETIPCYIVTIFKDDEATILRHMVGQTVLMSDIGCKRWALSEINRMEKEDAALLDTTKSGSWIKETFGVDTLSVVKPS